MSGISASPSLVGRTLDAGALKLTAVLGSGGYGTVYCARGPNNRQLAVKVVEKREGRRRVQLGELFLHSRVSTHPNIVTFHRELPADEKNFYFVFDAHLGGDLHQAIYKRALYFNNDDLFKRAFVQLIDAVQFCHENGIFHRDLKPENILCSLDGSRIFLTDFGLATENQVSTSFQLGTPPYMSPELLRKDLILDSYSPRCSDIWALGIIFVNMTTGRSPWSLAAGDDECFVVYQSNPVFIRQMLPLSEPTCALLKRTLTFHPRDRIDLEQLRAEVIHMETFFISEAEMNRATGHMRSVIDSARILKAAASKAFQKSLAVAEQETQAAQPDRGAQFPHPSLIPGRIAPHNNTLRRPLLQPPTAYAKPDDQTLLRPPMPFYNPTSAFTASDAGPVTPETYPCRDVDVAKFTDYADNFELPHSSALSHVKLGAKRWRNSSRTTFMRETLQIFRRS